MPRVRWTMAIDEVPSFPFAVSDFERARGRFIRLPLESASEPLFPYFWHPRGGSRGSGTTVSVLVAVMLDSWRFKHDFGSDSPSQWTRAAYGTVRRASALSGCD